MVPTPAGYQAQLDVFTGRSINDAVATLGAPTRTVELAQGQKLYVWEEKSEMRTPIVGEERYNPQTRSETVVLHGHERVPLDCFTELRTDASGMVVGNRFEGIACVGVAPAAGSAVTAAPTVASPTAAAPTVAAPAPPTPASEPVGATAAIADEPVVADGADTEETSTAADKREERRKMRRARPPRERRQE